MLQAKILERLIIWLLKAQKEGVNPGKKVGIEVILVSKEAIFFYTTTYPNSTGICSGENIYDHYSNNSMACLFIVTIVWLVYL